MRTTIIVLSLDTKAGPYLYVYSHELCIVCMCIFNLAESSYVITVNTETKLGVSDYPVPAKMN